MGEGVFFFFLTTDKGGWDPKKNPHVHKNVFHLNRKKGLHQQKKKKKR